MSDTVQQRVVALAGVALSVAWGGAADAQTVRLTSKAPQGYTPRVFDGAVNSSGSFDVSGAGYDVINITGAPQAKTDNSGNPKTDSSGQPKTKSQLTMSSANPLNTIAADNQKAKVSAYSQVPTTYTAGSTTKPTLAYGGKSNFSATPMYGETGYTGAGGVASNGYFKGTFDGTSKFTLLDYGTVSAAAAPEPSTWALLATGFLGIGLALRRRRKAIGGDDGMMLGAAAA